MEATRVGGSVSVDEERGGGGEGGDGGGGGDDDDARAAPLWVTDEAVPLLRALRGQWAGEESADGGKMMPGANEGLVGGAGGGEEGGGLKGALRGRKDDASAGAGARHLAEECGWGDSEETRIRQDVSESSRPKEFFFIQRYPLRDSLGYCDRVHTATQHIRACMRVCAYGLFDVKGSTWTPLRTGRTIIV